MATTTEVPPKPKKKKVKKKYITTTGVVSEMIYETPDTQTLRIRMPNLSSEEGPFIFAPGQFVMVHPIINEKKIPRAYSISSSPTRSEQEDGYIDLTVRQTEAPTVSKWLNDRKTDDEVVFKGPYGHFLWNDHDPDCSQVFMLGGGSGVTPLKCILEYIHDKKLDNKVKLIYSVRTQEDIISYNELKNLDANTQNGAVLFTLTREPKDSDWEGIRGRINLELVKKELEDFDLSKTKGYLCGTPAFVNTMIEFLIQAGLSKEDILHEKWD